MNKLPSTYNLMSRVREHPKFIQPPTYGQRPGGAMEGFEFDFAQAQGLPYRPQAHQLGAAQNPLGPPIGGPPLGGHGEPLSPIGSAGLLPYGANRYGAPSINTPLYGGLPQAPIGGAGVMPSAPGAMPVLGLNRQGGPPRMIKPPWMSQEQWDAFVKTRPPMQTYSGAPPQRTPAGQYTLSARPPMVTY